MGGIVPHVVLGLQQGACITRRSVNPEVEHALMNNLMFNFHIWLSNNSSRDGCSNVSTFNTGSGAVLDSPTGCL